MTDLRAVVDRFATALDNDDYDAAALCMEEDAVYLESSEKTINGRNAILDSFRHTSQWGRNNLDSLRFFHSIDEATPSQIKFIDVLTSGGEELELHHTMHLLFSPRGLIRELRLAETPGEAEQVRTFFRRHGLQRG